MSCHIRQRGKNAKIPVMTHDTLYKPLFINGKWEEAIPSTVDTVILTNDNKEPMVESYPETPKACHLLT